jgi:pSer/pThr/pTyr-binding forkhead associated (FHA) protein
MEALLNGPLGQTILGGKVVTIGRMPTNQIVLANDNQVSGRHAEIHPNAQGYTLIDLGSINGTFVNGQRLTSNVPYLLKVGDTIRTGQTTFFFEVRGAYQMASLGQPSPTGCATR